MQELDLHIIIHNVCLMFLVQSKSCFVRLTCDGLAGLEGPAVGEKSVGRW